MSSDKPQHVILILPFTSPLLHSPSPILETIFHALTSAQRSLLVYFSTPSPSITDGLRGGHVQLYDLISSSPRRNWGTLQRFLSAVYSTLAAAQWETGRVGMQVDVGFQGVRGRWEGRFRRCDVVLSLEGYTDLPHPPLPPHIIRTILPRPSIPSTSAPPSPSSTFSPPTSPSTSTSTSTHTRPKLHSSTPSTATPSDLPIPVVALGGTFDHLHAAHKLLLHAALFLAGRKLIVGVITQSMLANKTHAELVEPLDTRIEGVREFLQCLGGGIDDDAGRSINTAQPSHSRKYSSSQVPPAIPPRVELFITEIHDPYGPTAHDPDIQALVISDETRSGGKAVNEMRRQKGWEELEVWCIEVISARRVGSGARGGEGMGIGDDGLRTESLTGLDEARLKEIKMGSTGIRRWLAERVKSAASGSGVSGVSGASGGSGAMSSATGVGSLSGSGPEGFREK